MQQQILRLLQEVDKEICEGGEVRLRNISGVMHSMPSYPGLTQSRFCWKDFVKLQQKKILFLTPSSTQAGCKMAGSTLGTTVVSFDKCFLWLGTRFNLNACTECGQFIVDSFDFSAINAFFYIYMRLKIVQCWFVRGVRSSHMYYKAGERESPESWTGNWRIESLKVDLCWQQW